MNNKVAALTVAFNEPRLLPSITRQFKRPYLEEDIYHLVLVSRKPWRGDYEYDPDTAHVAIEHGADLVLTYRWENQAEQFNYGLKALALEGYEWAIICDADEFYTPFGIKILLDDIELFGDKGQLRAPLMEVYWKNPMLRIYNKQTDTPVVAISTSQFFSDKRTPTLSEYGETSAMLHHMSYVRTDDEMLKKINSFEHSTEFDLNDWYENKWKNWDLIKNNINLHPVVPEQFSHAVRGLAPKEILNNYYFRK